jgi:hypothetical protein
MSPSWRRYTESSVGAKREFVLLLLGRVFWRERGDDLLEARIAAEGVPEGRQFNYAVAVK